MRVNTLQWWTNKLVSLPRKWQGLKKNVMQTKLKGAFLVIVHNGGKCGLHMWLWQRNFYQTKLGFCDSPAHKKTFSQSGGWVREGREENRPKKLQHLLWSFIFKCWIWAFDGSALKIIQVLFIPIIIFVYNEYSCTVKMQLHSFLLNIDGFRNKKRTYKHDDLQTTVRLNFYILPFNIKQNMLLPGSGE